MNDPSPPHAEAWTTHVDRLYDSVGREQHLAAALGAFLPFFDARGVAFVTIADMRHPTTSHTGSVGVPEPSLVEYHTHFHAHDEWVLACHRRADFVPGATYRGSDLVDRQQLQRSCFWRAFLSRWGITDILTALIEASGADGPASFITFHRHQGQRPYAKSRRAAAGAAGAAPAPGAAPSPPPGTSPGPWRHAA